MEHGVVPSGLSGDDPMLDFLVIVALLVIGALGRLYFGYRARKARSSSLMNNKRTVQRGKGAIADASDKANTT